MTPRVFWKLGKRIASGTPSAVCHSRSTPLAARFHDPLLNHERDLRAVGRCCWVMQTFRHDDL